MMLSRRQALRGASALVLAGIAGKSVAAPSRIFDSHLHIIDHRFPIVPNQGYTPPDFSLNAYLAEAKPLGVRAGAVVSGSFHGFDQTYLRAVLGQLGAGWVGVTQVPNDIPDGEIKDLASIGIRALRFNMFRGRIDSVDEIVSLATRAHAAGGWHAEIYADAAALKPHVDRLAKLPQLVIDHLGMTTEGLPVVLDLVAAGAKVKASGFGRVKLDVPQALEAIAKKNPAALVFGSDIPSTRAARPFMPSDITLIEQVLGAELAAKVFWDNAVALYRLAGAAG
jgi:predicted TIM-barrel fold metal-dependent hydrolase